MVHKYAGRGIKKYEPIRLIGFDFDKVEWVTIDLYPQTKVAVVHPSGLEEEEKVMEFEKIKDGVE